MKHQLIVFSDLDGTLLDHESYRYEEALVWINKIRASGAPLILATSKTKSEVCQWQEILNIDCPYIVENGSAVVFSSKEEVVLGVSRDDLESFILDYEKAITSLTTCTIDQAVALTDLSIEDAEKARDRHYSIPFVLHDAELESTIVDAANLKGYRIIKGGRFFHLQGNCDKADAVSLIAQRYEDEVGGFPIRVVLGDNENDRAMLEGADIPVVVKSDIGHVLKLKNKKTIYTTQTAPAGWGEAIGRVFRDLEI